MLTTSGFQAWRYERDVCVWPVSTVRGTARSCLQLRDERTNHGHRATDAADPERDRRDRVAGGQCDELRNLTPIVARISDLPSAPAARSSHRAWRNSLHLHRPLGSDHREAAN